MVQTVTWLSGLLKEFAMRLVNKIVNVKRSSLSVSPRRTVKTVTSTTSAATCSRRHIRVDITLSGISPYCGHAWLTAHRAVMFAVYRTVRECVQPTAPACTAPLYARTRHLQWAISQRRCAENPTAISVIYNHGGNFVTAVLGEIHFRTTKPAVYGLRLSWTHKV